ncbi:MAG: ATP-binding protein [Planctomycetota bacterium]
MPAIQKSDHPCRLSPTQARWTCDPEFFSFETTDDVDPALNIVGQQSAYDALLFGIQCSAPGQNVYVRGSRGTGRNQMVSKMLEDLKPTSTHKKDYCYVHNFNRPQSPRLITLPPGRAPVFRKVLSELADFIERRLPEALESEPYSSQLGEMKEKIESDVKSISKPLEEELAASQLALVSIQNGPVTQTVIMPTIEGEPVPPNQLKALIAQGKAEPELLKKFMELVPSFQKQLDQVSRDVADAFREGNQQLVSLRDKLATELIRNVAAPIFEKFDHEEVHEFLEEIIDDAIEFRLDPREEEKEDLSELYGVNIVLTHKDPNTKPVVVECTPSLINLLGTVEPKWGPGGMALSDYRGIAAGALLNADQGFLVLDAEDVLAEPGAWRSLMRTLRTGRLEIVPPELGWMRQQVVIQPEPIEIDVRVILIGDVQTYYILDRTDSDFQEHFKVLADFDNELDRSDDSVQKYASVVANIARQENLPALDKSAVAVLVEHGARIASRANQLTARFGRIADLIREAAFLAEQSIVTADHVRQAIQRTKERASLPSRKFQHMIASNTILVQTQGLVVGQVNGLAVMHSGPLTYGFPARITATIGPGRAGLINIEGRAQMSGAIHTKGFHIIGGLLRHLLRSQHPLAFSASIAFEQSYGGIDGDSASGAEVVCLISALTGVPINQGMSMTGAIDQHGHVEAIGGVNEKIEGFFDTCVHFGLTGDQGVVIPESNQGDLMLRPDIVKAIRDGQFHIFAVTTIYEAIELMTGMPAGRPEGTMYEEGTVLQLAVQKAQEYWEKTLASPANLTTTVDDSVGDHSEIARRVDGDTESHESA